MTTQYSNPRTEAIEKYPALMAYIESRNAIDQWHKQLANDEQEAELGYLADVASDMQQARADYATLAQAKGHDGYPYNRPMGEYLGLPIRSNDEPPHGYYMASCVTRHFALGVARRKAQELIAAGCTLKIVTARSKETRKPIRYATFTGPDQIKIAGRNVVIFNGKQGANLSSNWSVETCMQKLVAALESGNAYQG